MHTVCISNRLFSNLLWISRSGIVVSVGLIVVEIFFACVLSYIPASRILKIVMILLRMTNPNNAFLIICVMMSCPA